MSLTVLSLGAGVQSTVMALLAERGDLPKVDACIFADTQSEPLGIYEHLDWLETQLSFPVLRVSKGSLRDDLYNRANRKRTANPPFFASVDGVEAPLWRQCTREYKVEPIEQKIRELVGLKPRQRYPKNLEPVKQWIGISTDEAIRMKPARMSWVENSWPLIEIGMSRQDCIRWFDTNFPGRHLAKSACTFCPYHSNASFRDMKLNDPVSFADAVSMDEEIRSGVSLSTNEFFIHRSLIPLAEVDFRNQEDMGQLNMFGNECEGLCGV